MTTKNNLDFTAITVLIVDDEAREVEELVEHLASEGVPAVGVSSAVEARQAFLDDTHIGVLLVDIGMPEEDGFSFIDWAISHYEGERIFEAAIFSGHRSQDMAVEAMRAGARDYFEKPLDLEMIGSALKRAIARVAQRRERVARQRPARELTSLDSALSSIREELNDLRQAISSDPQPHETEEPPVVESSLDSRIDRLTSRQKEVMKLVANAYSNYQIACELGISENTVKLYVSQILHTLGLSNRTQVALFFNRVAYDSGRN